MPYEFDLEKYLRASRKVPIDDLPWDTLRDHPLYQGEVRFLKYMMNIEAHTIVYHKELLSTKAIEDAEVTGFLACWNYEEFFHGQALEKFLTTYIGRENVRNEATYRLRQTSAFARGLKKVLSPLVTAATPDFAAVHMTWGATQELTTLHGYESLARQTRHPVLKELMARIVRDERRHFAFYYNQAEKRLAQTPRMQRITRLAMDKVWRPVGVGAMPMEESDFSMWYLFREDVGLAAIREVEQTMGQLPGMQGWNALGTATRKSIKDAAAREPGLDALAYADVARPALAPLAA